MTKISYAGYRFPPEIIQQGIWLYLRFTLSFRDVEDLLAERPIVVSYETVRRRGNQFGPNTAAILAEVHQLPKGAIFEPVDPHAPLERLDRGLAGEAVISAVEADQP